LVVVQVLVLAEAHSQSVVAVAQVETRLQVLQEYLVKVLHQVLVKVLLVTVTVLVVEVVQVQLAVLERHWLAVQAVQG